ncbi:MAG: TetR/AcrR family transcriptional regulator [Desulfarculaceae bacterium]|nr:TetR/AcrR family transcriptional regulator [Desulfarculaceae bacterium]MCF8046819.1 TetR/AcrR family transcriptional regulator [Desulfarculaceae bacterium]MCF8065096.1 TetR/AcrR family transcriptional regulator [Desulfarculaceae bacterium]MCF8097447.1 TetR/AcrR family transcriptional regulator [Desulfarculaceae bacterium]MCF8121408.1 TetR/AcrR family transcriptional regulator [Desulfarculaceae bacterium]
MSRKQDIIDAATDLFSQNGYHATSTHQVAKLAEVSEGIIFYYFKTKEDILLEIFYDSFDTFLESLQRIMDEAPTGLDALRAWVGIHFEAIDSRAKNILLLVRDFPASLANEDSPHRENILGRVAKLHQFLVKIIKRGQKDGSIGSCDPEPTALVLRSLLIGYTRVAMLENPHPPEFSKALWGFCRRALNPNPSQA